MFGDNEKTVYLRRKRNCPANRTITTSTRVLILDAEISGSQDN